MPAFRRAATARARLALPLNAQDERANSQLLAMLHKYKCVCLRVDISILVMCDGSSDITDYDRRTLELSNTPLYMKQDTTSIEQ